MADHIFISYSVADGLDFATKLFNKLEGGHPHIDAWLDKNRLKPGDDWDEQIAKAIRDCKCLVFAMSADSVAEGSTCKQEWVWALKYKKPVVPLLIGKKAQLPFRLGSRQWIDFTTDFEAGLAKLRDHIAYLNSEEGKLDELKHRLEDANRDLRRAKEEDQARIQADIDELKKQIETQEKVVANPEAAQKQTQANIEAGLERERQPVKPTAAQTSTKFINPPPGIAPTYFQDRYIETEQIVHFLQDDSQRMMTIVGRGGVGKTAMVCRLLKGLEGGELPDGLGSMKVDGIVYLSESGSHRVNFANLFYDLCKLLPADAAYALDAVYKNPQASAASKMSALLDRFTAGKVVLLLDNVEPLISVETFDIADAELDECLRALLHGAHSALKVILTTRVAPRGLNLCEPGKQRVLTLDSGLEQKYAVEMLREMDVDAKVGLKSADPEVLKRAYERTLGFPRALEALFAILASDRYTTLDELLAMPTPVNVVEALVGEAFNRLDTNAQKVMQALAVYNRPVTPAAVDYLLAPHLPAMDSAPILKRLVSMHFARRFEGGKFYLHPVDRDFTFDLIPDGSPDDTFIEKGGIQLFNKLWDLLDKYPDLLQNQDTFNQAVKNENANIVIGSVMAFQNLDDSLVEKMQQEGIFEDENFLAELDKSFHIPPIWSRYALNNRAADYFAQARKPRAEWKKLDDLSAQLAEFDLRCVAGDYDTAASVLIEIDYDYLFLWGHFRLMINLHERIQGKIIDARLLRTSIGNLGSAYFNAGQVNEAVKRDQHLLKLARENNDKQHEGAALGNLGSDYRILGDFQKAINSHEEALAISREIKNRQFEADHLGNLGNVYSDLGNVRKSIEYYEQALSINRETGNQKSEGVNLGNLGSAYSNLGDEHKAIEYYMQALTLSRNIGDKYSESAWLGNLGNRHINLGNIVKAIEFYDQALSINREIGDQDGEAIFLASIGGALIYLEDYTNAKDRYLLAIQIASSISSKGSQNYAYSGLAETYLFQNDLVNARATIEVALQYDVPENNHNASALHGIIALRQGEEVAAREAFVRAIGQADEILSKTAEYYSALDAKGLALAGLLVIGNWRLKKDDGQQTVDGGNGQSSTVYRQQAIDAFQKARKLAPHAGVVKSVLRLFDELVKCDEEGVLKDVREAIAPTVTPPNP